MRKLLLMAGFCGLLAACSEADTPSEPPQAGTPPAVAEDGFLTAYVEETIPMQVSELRAFMDERPLISFLKPTENIANPVEASVLEGDWPNPGAVRWLRLADGHYVVERVLQNDLNFFKYQVYVFTSATGRGVEQIVGEQRFVPTEDGTRFEWTYNVRPTNFITRQFVRASMPEIERYITSGLRRFAEAARAEGTGGLAPNTGQ